MILWNGSHYEIRNKVLTIDQLKGIIELSSDINNVNALHTQWICFECRKCVHYHFVVKPNKITHRISQCMSHKFEKIRGTDKKFPQQFKILFDIRVMKTSTVPSIFERNGRRFCSDIQGNISSNINKSWEQDKKIKANHNKIIYFEMVLLVDRC